MLGAVFGIAPFFVPRAQGHRRDTAVPACPCAPPTPVVVGNRTDNPFVPAIDLPGDGRRGTPHRRGVPLRPRSILSSRSLILTPRPRIAGTHSPIRVRVCPCAPPAPVVVGNGHSCPLPLVPAMSLRFMYFLAFMDCPVRERSMAAQPPWLWGIRRFEGVMKGRLSGHRRRALTDIAQSAGTRGCPCALPAPVVVGNRRDKGVCPSDLSVSPPSLLGPLTQDSRIPGMHWRPGTGVQMSRSRTFA